MRLAPITFAVAVATAGTLAGVTLSLRSPDDTVAQAQERPVATPERNPPAETTDPAVADLAQELRRLRAELAETRAELRRLHTSETAGATDDTVRMGALPDDDVDAEYDLPLDPRDAIVPYDPEAAGFADEGAQDDAPVEVDVDVDVVIEDDRPRVEIVEREVLVPVETEVVRYEPIVQDTVYVETTYVGAGFFDLTPYPARCYTPAPVVSLSYYDDDFYVGYTSGSYFSGWCGSLFFDYDYLHHHHRHYHRRHHHHHAYRHHAHHYARHHGHGNRRSFRKGYRRGFDDGFDRGTRTGAPTVVVRDRDRIDDRRRSGSRPVVRGTAASRADRERLTTSRSEPRFGRVEGARRTAGDTRTGRSTPETEPTSTRRRAGSDLVAGRTKGTRVGGERASTPQGARASGARRSAAGRTATPGAARSTVTRGRTSTSDRLRRPSEVRQREIARRLAERARATRTRGQASSTSPRRSTTPRPRQSTQPTRTTTRRRGTLDGRSTTQRSRTRSPAIDRGALRRGAETRRPSRTKATRRTNDTRRPTTRRTTPRSLGTDRTSRPTRSRSVSPTHRSAPQVRRNPGRSSAPRQRRSKRKRLSN